MKRLRIKEAMLSYQEKTGQRITQKELAVIVFPNCNPNTAETKFNLMVNGKRKNVTGEQLKAIATALKCSVDYLVS